MQRVPRPAIGITIGIAGIITGAIIAITIGITERANVRKSPGYL